MNCLKYFFAGSAIALSCFGQDTLSSRDTFSQMQGLTLLAFNQAFNASNSYKFNNQILLKKLKETDKDSVGDIDTLMKPLQSETAKLGMISTIIALSNDTKEPTQSFDKNIAKDFYDNTQKMRKKLIQMFSRNISQIDKSSFDPIELAHFNSVVQSFVTIYNTDNTNPVTFERTLNKISELVDSANSSETKKTIANMSMPFIALTAANAQQTNANIANLLKLFAAFAIAAGITAGAIAIWEHFHKPNDVLERTAAVGACMINQNISTILSEGGDLMAKKTARAMQICDNNKDITSGDLSLIQNTMSNLFFGIFTYMYQHDIKLTALFETYHLLKDFSNAVINIMMTPDVSEIEFGSDNSSYSNNSSNSSDI